MSGEEVIESDLRKPVLLGPGDLGAMGLESALGRLDDFNTLMIPPDCAFFSASITDCKAHNS